MNFAEIIVLLGSVSLITFILYYFFGPKGEAESSLKTDEAQIVTIVVDGAYSPSSIELKVKMPAEIIFDRRDKGDCTEWVVFDRFATDEKEEIKARLPEGQKTSVKFTPTETGSFNFACGMGMVKGKLTIVK